MKKLKSKFLMSKNYLMSNQFVEDKFAKTESYFFRGKKLPIVNKKLLNCLMNISNYTKKSVRINLHYDQKSKKHNMIILHRKNSEQKIHSHEIEGETVQMIKGKVKIYFYKKNLKLEKKVVLDEKNNIILSIPKKKYHKYEIISKIAIYHEFSVGPFIRKNTKFIS